MKTITGHWRIKKAKNNIAKVIVENKKHNPDNNHYVFADPRGGSTWLTEIIQEITQEPVMWEPLHINKKNSPFKKLNFG